MNRANNGIAFTLPYGASSATVELFNLKGKTVASQVIQGTGSRTFNLPVAPNSLANGIYIFRLQTGGSLCSVFTRAITIQR